MPPHVQHHATTPPAPHLLGVVVDGLPRPRPHGVGGQVDVQLLHGRLNGGTHGASLGTWGVGGGAGLVGRGLGVVGRPLPPQYNLRPLTWLPC